MRSNKGNAVAGFLFWVMAAIGVALLMPSVKNEIDGLLPKIGNFTNASLITLIITYWPVFFGIMILIIFMIVISRRPG